MSKLNFAGLGLLFALLLPIAAHASPAAAPHAGPAPQSPGSRTAVYFVFGQSNAVGIAPLSQLAASVDYSTLPVPIQEVQLFTGTGETAQFRLRNLRYIRTRNENVVDSIDGPVTGPRGETVIDLNTQVPVTAMSSFVGVAEAVADGYLNSASKIILMKVARGGTLIDGHDPFQVPAAGIIYKNGRRAYIRWLRGFVDAEVKAGRFVDLQMAEFDQGEREAGLAKISGQLPSPQMLAWAEKMRAHIYPYYVEKFGVAYPLLIRQLIPIRTANSPTAPLDPYTAAQNEFQESVCRYTVRINPDGTIAAVIDNGASPTRLDNAYFLKHDMNPASYADVHADYRLNRAFGRAKVNLEQYLRAANPNAPLPAMTRIAPVIMKFSSEAPTITTVTVNLFVDEVAKIYLLAVPAGSPAPGAATIKLAGKSFRSTVSANGDGFMQPFRLTGLKASRVYDIYACVADPVFDHTGSVVKIASGVATTS